MMTLLKRERWSPYVAGVLIGLLALASLLIFNKTIGISTTFVKISAFFWAVFDPSHLQTNAYYPEYIKNKSWIDWQSMLVLGVFIGSFLSRKLASASSPSIAPIFTKKRTLQAFIGGIILMLGARLAGGCTSGHAITGGFQLAASGWIFMMGVFALGIPTALVMYRKR
jgi:uncharacterized protein